MDSTEGPDQPGKPADIKHPEAGRGLDAVWERLIKLERSVPGQLRNLPADVGKGAVPAWRRVTEGEARWQVSLAAGPVIRASRSPRLSEAGRALEARDGYAARASFGYTF